MIVSSTPPKMLDFTWTERVVNPLALRLAVKTTWQSPTRTERLRRKEVVKERNALNQDHLARPRSAIIDTLSSTMECLHKGSGHAARLCVNLVD
ncbi:hypothetical protein CLAIMM_02403 [Cladophialophora immunda]|nr:hypothetical protein CLAIMM_02403 [Cladophialophora immunda]